MDSGNYSDSSGLGAGGVVREDPGFWIKKKGGGGGGVQV